MNRGFTCKGCGARHHFPVYVIAHWNEALIFTCPGPRLPDKVTERRTPTGYLLERKVEPQFAGCGQQYRIRAGRATKVAA